MDCLVCVVGDSLLFSTIHFGSRALGMSNAEINAGLLSSNTGPRYHWRRCYQNNGKTTIVCNYALSGTRLSDATGAWLANIDALAINNGQNRRHILLIGWGTNQGPTPASTFISSMESFIAARKAAGWDDIILQTIPSRTDATWGALGQQNEAYAKPINDTYLDTGWQTSQGVYISDIAIETNIGPWNRTLNAVATPSNNALNFYDAVHPSRSVVEIAMPIIQNAINSRINAVNGVIIPTTI